MVECLSSLCDYAPEQRFAIKTNFYNAVQRDNLRFNLDTANQFVLKDNLALSLRRLAGKLRHVGVG